jgi:hypothetical protein
LRLLALIRLIRLHRERAEYGGAAEPESATAEPASFLAREQQAEQTTRNCSACKCLRATRAIETVLDLAARALEVARY